MNVQLDTVKLFVKQMRGHSAVLIDILSSETTAAAPASVMDRCVLGTRMLAGTSSLMGYSMWEQVLSTYEKMLVLYCENSLLWDDRIAQVTSELIEKEECLIEGHENDAAVPIVDLIHIDELNALREEITVWLESIDTTISAEVTEPAESADDVDPVQVTDPVSFAELPKPSEPTDTVVTPSGEQQQPVTALPQHGVAPSEIFVTPVAPMNGVISELKDVCLSLVNKLESKVFTSQNWSSSEVSDIREQLCFLDFYVNSIEQMIERHDSSVVLQKGSLVPLKVALTDFTNEISGSGERALDVTIIGEEDVAIDPHLLSAPEAILIRMITDIFNRSEGETLSISIAVEEKEAAIHWCLSDDGDNFISDSRLDHEDQLAFYPGLKEVRKILARYNGVLWVEPNDDREIRFEFTLPSTLASDLFLVWNEDVDKYGIRSVQLCSLIPTATASTGKDMFGEFLTIDNRRVPLLRLGTLFEGAPSSGDNIAVIGSLEKRIAFFVSNTSEVAEGKILPSAVPVWRGPAHTVAEVDGRRIALLDADRILEVYLDCAGGLDGEETPVRVAKSESTPLAGVDSNDETSSDQSATTDKMSGVEVLVVEQSGSLRNVFTNILGRNKISAAYAASAEEAIRLVELQAPRVIISEFRMPTMAAKFLVEALDDEGITIPVLVTTSQSGKTAELLVEKLGVAGFLNKPLEEEEVVSRINRFLTERAPTA